MKAVITWLYKRKWILVSVGCVLLVFVTCCAFFRIYSLFDVLAYYGMIENPNPMVRDFALRRFNKGDSVSDLLQRYPKQEVSKFGHFTMTGDTYSANASNYTTLGVIAKDGRMVYAVAEGSVNGQHWDFAFFHTTNDEELDRALGREVEKVYPQPWTKPQDTSRKKP